MLYIVPWRPMHGYWNEFFVEVADCERNRFRTCIVLWWLSDHALRLSSASESIRALLDLLGIKPTVDELEKIMMRDETLVITGPASWTIGVRDRTAATTRVTLWVSAGEEADSCAADG